MTTAHAHDPYAELDALVREAMGLTPERALEDPAHEPLAAARPEPFAEYGGKVVSLSERISEAVLQGFSRKRH
jgi:hypothetical protein